MNWGMESIYYMQLKVWFKKNKWKNLEKIRFYNNNNKIKITRFNSKIIWVIHNILKKKTDHK